MYQIVRGCRLQRLGWGPGPAGVILAVDKADKQTPVNGWLKSTSTPEPIWAMPLLSSPQIDECWHGKPRCLRSVLDFPKAFVDRNRRRPACQADTACFGCDAASRNPFWEPFQSSTWVELTVLRDGSSQVLERCWPTWLDRKGSVIVLLCCLARFASPTRSTIGRERGAHSLGRLTKCRSETSDAS